MKRPFGQHFLFDPNILRKILSVSNITTKDTVIEIGPGFGTMTELLSAQAKKVIAIEVDKKLIKKLKENLSNRKNIDIVVANALKFPYETIKGRFKVVANIPYYITTPLLFKLLEYKEKIPSMTLLLQKEVAERIVAFPHTKDYGVLSISMQLCTKPALKFIVSRKSFTPPPEVDSAVVHFEVPSTPLFKIDNEDLFFKLVRTAFSQRRKTIANSLKIFKGIKYKFQETGINPKLRPENLSIEDFVRLANAFANLH